MIADRDVYLGRYLDALLFNRGPVLTATICVVLVCIFGLSRLGFSLDNRDYFDESNIDRLNLEAVERDHGRFTNALLVVVPKSGTILTKKSLSLLRDAGQRLLALDEVVRIASIITQPVRLPDGPPLVDGDDEIDAVTIENIKSAIKQRRANLSALVSADNTTASVAALIRVDPEEPDRQLSVARNIQDIRDTLAKKNPDIDVYLTGDAILDATFIKAILRDLVYLVPFQVGATIVLLLFALQSVVLTIALLLVLGAAIAITMGFAGFFGLELNGVTSATPVILMGLSIATGIHILFAWQRACRDGGDWYEALQTTMQLNAFPVTLATATTVVSFLCLNFSDAPPFRELGNLIAFGLIVTWLLSFTVLPILISCFPNALGQRRHGFEQTMSDFGKATIAYRASIVTGFTIAVAVSIVGIAQLQFDDRFSHYFDKSYDFRVSTDKFESKLSGLDALYFSIPVSSGSNVWAQDYLSKVDRFQNWLGDQPHVSGVHGLPDIIKTAALAIPGQKPNTLPSGGFILDRIVAALKEQLARSPTPYILVAKDEAKSLTTVVLRGVGSSDIRKFANDAENWLKKEMPDHYTRTAGMPLISAHMAQRNANAMVAGTFIALLVVSLMMFFVLDSAKLGFVSLIPNLVPMILAFGFWGLVFGKASFAVTVVGAITFGLVVDGTIHILSRYRYARATLNLKTKDAIPYSISTVGLAVLATALAVASGFATLAFSGFLVNHELGFLCCIVLAAALLADLLFLPALMFLLDGDPEPSS